MRIFLCTFSIEIKYIKVYNNLTSNTKYIDNLIDFTSYIWYTSNIVI